MDNILDRIEAEERERELEGYLPEEDKEILGMIDEELGDEYVDIDDEDDDWNGAYGWADDGLDW